MFGVWGKYIRKPKYIRSCHGTEYAVVLFDPSGVSREKGAHINLINIWKRFESQSDCLNQQKTFST